MMVGEDGAVMLWLTIEIEAITINCNSQTKVCGFRSMDAKKIVVSNNNQ